MSRSFKLGQIRELNPPPPPADDGVPDKYKPPALRERLLINQTALRERRGADAIAVILDDLRYRDMRAVAREMAALASVKISPGLVADMLAAWAQRRLDPVRPAPSGEGDGDACA